MTKSQEIFNKMNEDELKIMLLIFASPNILEAMRIYNTMPAHSWPAFYEAAKIALKANLNKINTDPEPKLIMYDDNGCKHDIS